MEAKSPKPSQKQIERVESRLKRGARLTEVKQCCSECRAALKWVLAKKAEDARIDALAAHKR